MGEGESSYLPASVLDEVSSGFNMNPVMLALLPPLHRSCSSPGVREEQAGRGGWLCPHGGVFSCAVHTISLQLMGILVLQSSGVQKLVPSCSQVPRVMVLSSSLKSMFCALVFSLLPQVLCPAQPSLSLNMGKARD